jgi:hypothetical protein
MVYLSFSIKNIEIAEAQLPNNLKKIAVYTVVLIVYLLTPRRPSFFYLGRLKCLKVYTTFEWLFLINNYNQCLLQRIWEWNWTNAWANDEHITKLVSKCIKSLCQINQIKHILDDCIQQIILLFICVGEHFQHKLRQTTRCAKLCCENRYRNV